MVGGLGDVNNDGINDFAIGTPDAGDSAGKVFGVLGGSENLAALDSADGADDDAIDVGAYTDGTPPVVTFIETDSSVTFGGTTTGTVDLRLSQSQATGTISIDDTETAGDDSFNTQADVVPLTSGTPEGTGTYGTLFVDDDGGDDGIDRWTYVLNTSALAVIALGAGQSMADQVILTADNGSQRAINITIIGKDDPTVYTVTPDGNGFGITEDLFSISGDFSAEDPDQDQTAAFGPQSITGTYGTFIIEEGGRFTYVLDQDAVKAGGGFPLTETITPSGATDSFSFSINASGGGNGTYTLSDENGDNDGTGVTAFFGDGSQNITGSPQGDTIDTGKGDDVVNGAAGNDVITDAYGDDTLSGGAGNDKITALSGQNTINDDGGTSIDVNYFRGGVGRDTITGGSGTDYIKGDISTIVGASDTLDGGAGSDWVSGGLGADTFVFYVGAGADTIANFDVSPSGDSFTISNLSRDFTPGLDVVQINAGAQFDVLAALETVGGHAVLNLGGGNTLTFYGVSEAELTADSFVFNIL